MEIRAGNLYDLNVCLKMDTAFETDYVWQMEARYTGSDIAIGFHPTRLPRAMKVNNVISPERVAFDAQNGGTLFVADDAGQVLGFAGVTITEWNQAVRINTLAVAAVHRRQGIGVKLVRGVMDWARQKSLRVVLADTPTKAYPAIRLFQKLGFSFCGFSDQLYANRDIALFFALNLR